MKISIIAAVGQNNEIGSKNKLLWHISSDLKRFKELTTNHHILMGLNTFNSIGKILPNRISLILSYQKMTIDGACVFQSIDDAIEHAKNASENELFIIGGGQIYNQTINLADKMYITKVNQSFPEADTFFPEFETKNWNSKMVFEGQENNIDFEFWEFSRK